MEQKSMHALVVEALRTTKATRAEIVTGARVEYDWLKILMTRGMKDPGVNKIERVFWFLVQRGDIDPEQYQPPVIELPAVNE